MRKLASLFVCLLVSSGSGVAADDAVPDDMFIGILPCADCPAIDYRLDLFGDGVYYLRMSYRERGQRHDEMGQWSLTENDTVLRLHSPDSGKTLLAMDAPEQLTLLDGEGRPIESARNYSLFRSELLAPITPSIQLDGMFVYYADSALLRECVTNRQMPVAMEGDYIELERAWLESGRNIEAPLFASIEARIEPRVNMEGPRRPTVIVERLISTQATGSCPKSGT